MKKEQYLKVYFIITIALYILLVFMGWTGWIPPNNYFIHQEFKQFMPPSSDHLLGTGYYRKDIFSEFVYGTSSTFFAGMAAAIPFLLFGTLFGIGSSYYENKGSVYIAKLLEVFNSFPKLLVLLIFIGLFGTQPIALMAIFGLISSPKLAELIKSRIISLKKESFIDSSIALGLSHFQIIFKHLLRYNCKEIIIGQFFYIYAAAILIEASLSYVRLGFSIYSVSWGYMLYEARSRTLFALPWSEEFNIKALIVISALTLLTLNLFYLAQYFRNKDILEKGTE